MKQSLTFSPVSHISGHPELMHLLFSWHREGYCKDINSSFLKWFSIGPITKDMYVQQQSLKCTMYLQYREQFMSVMHTANRTASEQKVSHTAMM